MGKKRLYSAFALILCAALLLSACAMPGGEPQQSPSEGMIASPEQAPAFSGQPYVEIMGNRPQFSEQELTTQAYERYAPLDLMERCGTAEACIGRELMPTEERGNIGNVRPSGWKMAKYDFVDGKYLYNRCHLIGFQLTGENANVQNLITGTRYMNVEGMLPFENMVADYVKETGNHVMYRVRPVFFGTELVARGVHMQAISVEDRGEGVCFNVYVYNCQPGVEIDYASGASRAAAATATPTPAAVGESYVINVSSKKFHLPSCPGAASMKEENRREHTGTREELERQGYEPCGMCKP